MKEKPIQPVFWALVGVFIIVVGIIFLMPPAPRLLMPPGLFMTILFVTMIIFVMLGAVLLALTVKLNVVGRIKRFLLLTGASAVGLPVAAVLHNLISGLTGFEEPVFFVVATIVCPVGFLVGAVGTLVIMIKQKRVQQSV